MEDDGGPWAAAARGSTGSGGEGEGYIPPGGEVVPAKAAVLVQGCPSEEGYIPPRRVSIPAKVVVLIQGVLSRSGITGCILEMDIFEKFVPFEVVGRVSSGGLSRNKNNGIHLLALEDLYTFGEFVSS